MNSKNSICFLSSSTLKYLKPYIFILLLAVEFFSAGKGQLLAGETPEESPESKILAQVIKADKFINKLDSLFTIDLPVGIASKDKADAQNYAVVIDKLKVENGISYISAFMLFTTPTSNKRILFRAKDIPLSASGGIVGSAYLELAKDVDVGKLGNIEMLLKAHETGVVFDCGGFVEMHVSADVTLDTAKFVAENDDGSIKTDPRVTTNISTVISDWNNLLVNINLPPFQFKPMPGLGFAIRNAVFDMSDFQNPLGLHVSSEYTRNYLIEGNPNLWRGIQIQELQVRLPQEFKKNQNSSDSTSNDTTFSRGDRISFYASNLTIDESGFSGLLEFEQLLTLQEGDMDGWDFSIDYISMEFKSSRLIAGGFQGQILIPEFSDNDLFNYSAIIGLNNTYAFQVSITDTINLDIFSADLDIEPNSSIEIAVVEGEFRPSLLLHGKMTLKAPVDKENPGKDNLEVGNIDFQGMRLQTVEPYFSVQAVSFGTEQNRFSNFPVTLTEIGIVEENNRIGLQIGAKVHFVQNSDGGFNGGGNFTVWAKRENKKWKYDNLQVDRIFVNVDKGENFHVSGQVLFVRGDEIYGNGFRGDVSAKFGGFKLDAIALFGNVNNYRYFMVDAKAVIESGIQAGPISFYGFGGGACYHMRQAGIFNTNSNIGRSLSGFNYVPDSLNGLALRASVKLGASVKKETFNADVEFGMVFTSSGGIDQITFMGKGYFATGTFEVSEAKIKDNAREMMSENGEIPLDETNASIWGEIAMVMDFRNNVFHSNFDIYVNVANGQITGVGDNNRAGWGVMHFEQSEWYIHIGTPENPNGIKVMNLAEMTNYLMVGHHIPPLPPPPSRVTNILNYTPDIPSSEMADGKGFAMGSYFTVETGEQKFLLFYGSFGCGLGFDIMLKKFDGYTCEGQSSMGINNWYAQGQAYAWVAATIGLKIDLAFYKGKYEILDLQTAALLKAEGPNPFWMKGTVGGRYRILNGLVKGNCNFDFEIGEKCEIVAEGSPLDGVKVIADITPKASQEDVDVFVTPQAVFNIPVNKSFSFNGPEGEKRTFKAVLNDFTIKYENGKELEATWVWNDDNTTVAYENIKMMDGQTNFTGTVKVTFMEIINGSWQVVKEEGQDVIEEKTFTFKTGDEPDIIVEENVASTYPFRKGLNFYQDDFNGGHIKMVKAQDNLFLSNQKWDQKIRLTNLWDKEVFHFDYTYQDGKLSFIMPEGLKGNNIYKLEVINIPANEKLEVDYNIEDSENVVVQDENSGNDVNLTTKEARGEREVLEEKILYTLHFRNSNYNTLEEKFLSLETPGGTAIENDKYQRLLYFYLTGEMFGKSTLSNNGSSSIALKAVIEQNDWYKKYVLPSYNALPSTIKNTLGVLNLPDECIRVSNFNTLDKLTNNDLTNGIKLNASNTIKITNYISVYMRPYYSRMLELLADHVAFNNNISTQQREIYSKILYTPLVTTAYGNYPLLVVYKNPNNIDEPRMFNHNLELTY